METSPIMTLCPLAPSLLFPAPPSVTQEMKELASYRKQIQVVYRFIYSFIFI